MFEGKIVLDANNLDKDQIVYLTEFKQELNEHIAKETEKRQRELDKIRKANGNKGEVDVDDPEFIRNTFSHLNRRRL